MFAVSLARDIGLDEVCRHTKSQSKVLSWLLLGRYELRLLPSLGP